LDGGCSVSSSCSGIFLSTSDEEQNSRFSSKINVSKYVPKLKRGIPTIFEVGTFSL